MNEAIKQKEGKKVYFGIRPRAFERAELADDTNKATIWKATIDVIETLGDELLAHVICGNHRFQVSLDAHQSKEKLEGDIELCPILPRAHVFDGKTEENLTMPKELFESAGRSGGDFNNK
jgi:ABC-type sugar transport system ATPase subunit